MLPCTPMPRQLSDSACNLQVLPLADHLSFCIAHRLPVNDAWLFSSPAAAAAADAALDAIANAALPTAAALTVLDSVAAQHASAAIRIHGTYPHAAWQGSRIEGFVIAQGGPVDTDVHTHLQQHARALRDHTLPLPKTRGTPSPTFKARPHLTPHRDAMSIDACRLSHCTVFVCRVFTC